MKIKTLLYRSFAFCVLLFSISSAKAITTSLTISDSFIVEGESFDVTVSIDGSGGALPAGTILTAFTFDVDPLSSLSNIAFIGSTVLAEFDDSLLFPDVSGSWLLTPPDVTLGSVDIATLNFSALTAGSDVVSIEGLISSFEGAFLLGPSDEILDRDIVASLDIAINKQSVPDSASTAYLLFLTLLGTFGFKRILKP